jgi:hypothetical protein
MKAALEGWFRLIAGGVEIPVGDVFGIHRPIQSAGR